MNRRDFLKYSSAGAAALTASAWVASGQSQANARISIGIIGTGGRGSALMSEIHALAKKHNAQITAICDVWQKNLRAAGARTKEWFGAEPRQCTRFGEVLTAKDLDAVVIATPDFAHAPILVAALQAGKDVYVEKPMSIDLALANEALDLARANNRIVQVGTQHRSEGRYIGATKLVATGALGQISRVTASVNFNEARWARSYADCQEAEVDWDAYLFNRPQRPFDPKLLRRWQLYRQCTNGLSGLWMSHYVDGVHQLTGAKYPRCAVALGGIYVWKDGREHTDTFHALLAYPEGFLFDWAMSLGNSAGNRFAIHGTKGTLDVENWTLSSAGGVGSTISTTPVPNEPSKPHMEHWLESLRSRRLPNADIQLGHQHAVATIMAAIALETGQRQEYDPVKRAITAG